MTEIKRHKFKLTLIKSTLGRLQSHKDTVLALGLKKIHQSVTVDDVPSMRGMINKVNYLLKINEV